MKIRHMAFSAAAAFALFGASQASAQTIGFKIGASFANVSGDDIEDTNSLTSLIGGGFVRFGMGGFAIQPEILYVTRGFNVEDIDGEVDVKMDYVEVPILAVVPLSLGAGISPYIFAGPSIAFNIGCKFEGEVDGVEDEVDCEDALFDMKSTDLGATVGAGLEFPMGPGNLLVEGRYNFGFTNVVDADEADVKTRTAAVMAGYSIPLGPRM